MTRHGRNATNSAVYSYSERQKDSRASGYGSNRSRLNKDAIKNFDCCSLTLQPCTNPVVTPEGWLYEKEVILKYIVEKRMEYRKKMTLYQSQLQTDFDILHQEAESEKLRDKRRFEEQESSIRKKTSTSEDPKSSKSGTLAAFWVPNLTPQATPHKEKKPEKAILCPCSGQPLKARDLIEVHFKTTSDSDTSVSNPERLKCAVTGDILRNTNRCFVLKPSGDVVNGDCVQRVIRKDMIHPLTGQSLVESDLIELQRGGTGFSAANANLNVTKYRPSISTA